MSITLDDKSVDVFKLYDEMAITYSKDIQGYMSFIDAIEVMIAQKQRKLQDIKDKTIDLITNSITSLEISPSQETPLHQKDKKFNYAGIDMEALIPGEEIESVEAVVEITPPIQVQRPRSARHRKTNGKGKAKRADKPKMPSLRSKNIPEKSENDRIDTFTENISKTESTYDITEPKCLYHPESPVLDQARQLCSSCKWKLINNGLKEYDKDPAVISFLKGETRKIPDLGQSMCPVHTAVPSYNQRTGLCKACQKKAKEMGVQNRHLTEKELKALRNLFS